MCIRDRCAEGRKREFLADPKFLTHKGFKVSDTSDCGINLMYLPLAESAQPPKFKACAKHPKVEENGFVQMCIRDSSSTEMQEVRVAKIAVTKNRMPTKVPALPIAANTLGSETNIRLGPCLLYTSFCGAIRFFLFRLHFFCFLLTMPRQWSRIVLQKRIAKEEF